MKECAHLAAMQGKSTQHGADDDDIANDDEHETIPQNFAGHSRPWGGVMRVSEMFSAARMKS